MTLQRIDAITKQGELLEEIQKHGISICICNWCNAVMLVKIEEENITCHVCKKAQPHYYCADLKIESFKYSEECRIDYPDSDISVS